MRFPRGARYFRRYMVRVLALGTVRSYFMREENDGVRAVANSQRSTNTRLFRNTVDAFSTA